MIDQRQASEVYELVYQQAPLLKRWARAIVVAALSLASAASGTSGPNNPGGRTVGVKDRRTGKIVIELQEALGDDTSATLSTLSSDLHSMTATDFGERWLDT